VPVAAPGGADPQGASLGVAVPVLDDDGATPSHPVPRRGEQGAGPGWGA